MKPYPSYSVAIRTLGTAGSKYLSTLQSVASQTLKPDNIFVYIPYGYDIPQETIGKEKYIRCQKGMVAQRARKYEEISSDFILFLDDDLSFSSSLVRDLFDGLIALDGDCIAPNIYPNHEEKFIYKIRNYLGGTRPHFQKDWAFIIRRDGHYSYNAKPKNDVLLTQSAAGACCLCRKSSFLSICFEDEIWLDRINYALGDDQLFFYKLFLHGYRVLISYSTSIKHLDAGAGHVKGKRNIAFGSSFARFVIWRRTIFDVSVSKSERLFSVIEVLLGRLISFPLILAVCLKYKSFNSVIEAKRGRKAAKSFVNSIDYLRIPSFK